MESKHLSKAAKPGQYRNEVTKATQAHKTKMQEMRSSRKAERKAKIQQSVGRRKR